MITRGITNELSAEHKIFFENLKPKKKSTEIYIKKKTQFMKEELAKKKLGSIGKIDTAILNKSNYTSNTENSKSFYGSRRSN